MPFLNFKNRHFSHEEKNITNIAVKYSIPATWSKLTDFTYKPYLQSINNNPIVDKNQRCQAFMNYTVINFINRIPFNPIAKYRFCT